MKHFKLTILLALFLNLIGVKAFAYELSHNGIYYDWDYTPSSTGFKVTYMLSTYSEEEHQDLYYSDYTGDIIIPSTVTYYGKSYPVVSIGDYAFSGCENLTSVIIPNSVSTIGYGAFKGCKSLSSVTLPSSIKRINSDAFNCDYDFYALNINITDLKAWCEMDSQGIGRPFQLYINGSLITHLDIPEGVTTIHDCAFCNCCKITKISIPEGVTAIGDYAFGFVMSESQVIVTIPSSIISIGYSAFDCTVLTSVTIKRSDPIALTWGAFSYYSNATLYVPYGSKAAYAAADYWKEFKEIVEMPNPTSPIINFVDANVKALCVANWDTNGDGELSEAEAAAVTDLGEVFCFNKTITSFDELSYFTNLKSISKKAFTNCSNLASVTLPDNITSIGEMAFLSCKGLSSISIPSSVTNIDLDAFSFCENLHTIHISDLTAWCNIQFQNNYCFGEYHLYLNGTEINEAADFWKEFKEIVEMESVPVEVTDISALDNALYIEPFSAHIGDEVNIEVRLKNAEAATSYGFELVLPEGMSIATEADNSFDDAVTLSPRNSKHTTTTNKLSADRYKVGVASLSSKALTGNDGLVLTIKAQVADDMAVGDYAVTIENPLLVSTDGTKPAIEATVTKVTIEDYVKGDVDGDGVVDLADAVLVINYYVGKTVSNFAAKAADVDGDGVIDLADAVKIINYYVGKIPSLSRGQRGEEHDPE